MKGISFSKSEAAKLSKSVWVKHHEHLKDHPGLQGAKLEDVYDDLVGKEEPKEKSKKD
jgi:hypothetical protein